MSTASAFYEGTIRHRRHDGPRRAFRHHLALAYVDLAELPDLLGGRLVRRWPGLIRFRRADYLGGGAEPESLERAVRDRVQALTGERPDGAIRLLTQLRTFGLCFNPVSFYYCLDRDGRRLRCVLAEVTNTPWGERHAYVLADPSPGSALAPTGVSGSFAKALHVSPFFGMDHRYRARASTPDETLSVHIANERDGVVVFDATLSLRRHELTRRAVRRQLRRQPLAAARVLALIYGHALALKLRGARSFPHPAPAR